MNRSEEVRDFYERMPYPAPLADLDAHRDLYKNPDRLFPTPLLANGKLYPQINL